MGIIIIALEKVLGGLVVWCRCVPKTVADVPELTNLSHRVNRQTHTGEARTGLSSLPE